MRVFIIFLLTALIAVPAFAAKDDHKKAQDQKKEERMRREDRMTKNQAEEEVVRRDKILKAIQRVETGGEKDPANAVGDEGLAKGWFQIHHSFWRDSFKSTVNITSGNYEADCKNLKQSKLVVVGYWHKYKPKTDKARALVFHYGPAGMPSGKFFATDPHKYWPKVEKAMKEIEEEEKKAAAEKKAKIKP